MNRIIAVAALALAAGGAGLAIAQEAQSISAKDRAIGEKAHPQMLAEYGGAYSGRQSAYVGTVGRRVAVQSGLADSERAFTITLLDSPVNNAFATPGGYVYVTRQLMSLMNDEAELAAVIGHEVGHVAARHAAKRQAAATRNSVLGGIGQVLAGVLTGNSTLGQYLGEGIGTGAQLLTLRYSRSQEYESDDLGVNYLADAGYDPAAVASMLGRLQAQTDLDARASGQTAPTRAGWTSTHPDPGARVARARQRAAGARAQAAAAQRNRDAFLAQLDGLRYGDDPREGVIEGRSFRHPDLKVAFTAPAGYQLVNSPQAVTVSGSGGQASFACAAAASPQAHATAVLTQLGARDVPATQPTQLNGMEAAVASTRGTSGNTSLDVTAVAFATAPGRACHFLTLTAAGSGVGPFRPMIDSASRLTDAQAAAIRGRVIDVMTVGPRDTVATLAARMAYPELREERFRVLNGFDAGARPTPGSKVKLIVYG